MPFLPQPLHTYGACCKWLQCSRSKSGQVWLQVGQEAHFTPHSSILWQAFVFFTMKPMNTEVFCIVKKAIMEMRIMNPVCFNFFRDCRRILAQEPGNLLKGTLLIERRFDIEPVIESQMFLVSGYKVTHRISFHCCQKEINHNITEREQSMDTRTPALTAGIYAMSDRRRRELKDQPSLRPLRRPSFHG